MLSLRQVVKIDEEKCNGCGDCLTACAEGALELVDGKARLIGEIYCDGLGACTGICPEGAITTEEREAPPFDEEAVCNHLAELWSRGEGQLEESPDYPSMRVQEFAVAEVIQEGPSARPALRHWPIKLKLVPPGAPFLRGADLILAADCTGFVWPDLRRELRARSALLIGCPRSDDHQFARKRLIDILQIAVPRSLTVVHMEAPCCSWHWQMAQEAVAIAGLPIPLWRRVIGPDGRLAEEERSES
ncbi:MAG: 4Fe-4S binding protein [Candidatus Latescibacteria bacterium]|nr:4Fe-4S binding protein [Candidatus Latescibacterota bacterium]